jgi:predicted alpha-1,6-mannanase (GH76 family)
MDTPEPVTPTTQIEIPDAPSPEQVKMKSGRRLFLERMRRDGRWREWQQKIKAKMAEMGKGFSVASWPTMREMGYVNSKTERELEAAYLDSLIEDKRKSKTEAIKEEIRRERSTANFEEAVGSLPAKAPYQEEIDWIRAHPAMMRLSKSKDKTKQVQITVDDVLCAPHGKAPSQSAVYMLNHWANCPGKFFEKILDEHKKIKDSNEQIKSKSKDRGIDEIESLLDAVAKEVT